MYFVKNTKCASYELPERINFLLFLYYIYPYCIQVIKGEDIFKKTTPQELDAFMEFVDGGPGYDVVIDGLNVANIKKRTLPGQVVKTCRLSDFFEDSVTQHRK